MALPGVSIMPLGPGAPKWKDITDVLGSAMGYVEPVAEALSYPLEAMGIAGPQARQLFVGDQPTTPVAPAMEYFGVDPATAQSVAETAEMFLPQVGAIAGGSNFQRKLMLDQLQEAKKYPGLHKGLRTTTSPGHTLSDVVLSPDPNVLGEYYPPGSIGKRGRIAAKRGGPDVPSTLAHEGVGHRTWQGLTPIQRQSIRNAVKKYGPHPRAGHYKDVLAHPNESFTYTVQEILGGQEFTGHPKLLEAVEEILGKATPKQKGLLSDLAQSSNIPLTEKEIDPLLRALELK
jgi:hypothetical protein